MKLSGRQIDNTEGTNDRPTLSEVREKKDGKKSGEKKEKGKKVEVTFDLKQDLKKQKTDQKKLIQIDKED